MVRVDNSVIERFWSKTEQRESGCIEWTAAKSDKGYGRFKVNGRLVLPHRFIMEWINQTTYSQSVKVRHRCDNPPCVNPAHLQTGTQSDNMVDCSNRGRLYISRYNSKKTKCTKGHPYNEENTIFVKNGWRQCRECKRLKDVRRHERERANRT